MEQLDAIRAVIAGFAGYQDEEKRRLADEQLRAYVGEHLAGISQDRLSALSAGERAAYDRVLVRCEFINQAVFSNFNENATPERIAGVVTADGEVLASLDDYARLEAAFDKRDAAMQGK